MSFQILLASARGMCAGVYRAINTVESALKKYGKERVYVLHEVVHNAHVVADLRALGAHFVDDLSEVPEGSVLIFSAHGVSCEVENKARELKFTIIDATCPVVTGIHQDEFSIKEGTRGCSYIGRSLGIKRLLVL